MSVVDEFNGPRRDNGSVPHDRPRVVVVEDDPTIRGALQVALKAEGFAVHGQPDGSVIETTLERFRPDLMILDVKLGQGRDGFAVATVVRAASQIPILFLTAADTLEDRLTGFRVGGDDYLVKPFSMAELQARINVSIRRSTPQASTRLTFDVIELDLLSRKVTAGGVEVRLTPTEFELLRLLLTYPGRVFTQRHLLATVWGPEYQDDAHILRTFVHQLRTKLSAASPGSGALIVNDPGVGYRIEPPQRPSKS